MADRPNEAAAALPAPLTEIPADAITVNLVRLAGLDKHKARECEAIVRQVLAGASGEVDVSDTRGKA